MTDKKSLQARWNNDPNKTKIINEALHAHGDKGLNGLVEKYEGRYDLRGFPLKGTIHERDLAHIDWSHMVFVTMTGCMISLCRVDDCLFVGTGGDEPVFRGTFTRCDFSKTAVKLFELHGQFSDCSFKEAKLTKTRAFMSTFTRCDFSSCKAAGADFSISKFTDCILRDSNFNEANLMRTELTGCDLHGTKAVGAVYEKTSIFRSCKNLDPAMIKGRDTLLSERPQVIP